MTFIRTLCEQITVSLSSSTILFNAVWCWNIKYLSNPWTTSLSQFSLVWLFKNTHTDWPASNKNAFKGVEEGVQWWWGWGGKAWEPINLCVSALLWHDGDFKWHGALTGLAKKKKERKEKKA